MATKPTSAQAKALRNILSAGYAHGVRVATVRALIRQGWIVPQFEDRPIIGASGVTWVYVQVTADGMKHLRTLDADLLAFRFELLENTAGKWNRDRYATSPATGRRFDLWTAKFTDSVRAVPAA